MKYEQLDKNAVITTMQCNDFIIIKLNHVQSNIQMLFVQKDLNQAILLLERF